MKELSSMELDNRMGTLDLDNVLFNMYIYMHLYNKDNYDIHS